MLEYIKNKYLQNLDSGIWRFIVVYIHRVVKRWLGAELDEEYVKSLIGSEVYKYERNKTLDEYLVIKYE